jgi:hypothetical protein
MKNLVLGAIIIVIIASCSQQSKKQASITPNIEIGSYFGDGYVFYLFKNGDYGYIEGEIHGYICSEDNLKAIWGCQFVNPSYLHHLLGDGKNNTVIIKNDCNGVNSASICPNGWWLPDSVELRLLYDNRQILPNLNKEYWTSDGYNQSNATSIDFLSGINKLPLITDSLYVRPIKQF